MERRAVMVSHELWKQIMTQGYESGGIRCIEGLPEDAKLVDVFYRFDVQPSQLPDPVFVFESASWGSKPSTYTVGHDQNTYPVMDVIFERAL